MPWLLQLLLLLVELVEPWFDKPVLLHATWTKSVGLQHTCQKIHVTHALPTHVIKKWLRKSYILRPPAAVISARNY